MLSIFPSRLPGRRCQGVLQPNVGQPGGSYATYPIPPGMGFITLKADI